MRLRVDWRASAALVGTVVKWLSVPLLVPLAVSLYYGDGGVAAFVVTILVALAVGTAMERVGDIQNIGSREGFLMVAGTWLAVSIVGALPYLVAAHGIPGVAAATAPMSKLANPANALFETMSGFTTTGATVLGEISFDRHSHGILMWRQLTQWLGGMGIVVLAVAILPELSVGGAQLMDAEAPGPGIQKLTPRIAETARALWLAYAGITAVEVLLLFGLNQAGFADNMGLYNAVAHGFTTMATGGFSPEAKSIEAFTGIVQWVIVPFMFAAGTNFALIWQALTGDLDELFGDAEFRFYAGVSGVFTAVIAGLLFAGPTLDVAVGPVAGEAEVSLRHAAFQAVSIVTTTGYASMDFAQWGEPAKYVLFLAIFVGGSAGSTGGAVKMVRWLVIIKSLKRELFTTIHPEAVEPVRLGGRALDESGVRGIYAFTAVYFALFAFGTVFVAIDASRIDETLSAIEVMSAVAATLGNVGPGFGMVGPMGSYEPLTNATKLLMVGLMWVGRLEVIPVLVLFTKSYWQD
ncbi:TrkH family potassium uptake protein [Halobacterium jilantaiense]|uniref:Trk system potassium uptake protein TrkH n=1 Tax=Halobacterium jilantaiense TaxID=355548 RepID=A0A1I0QC13_9EURY|nr:TrkH family potassium uptake protein [Halobacterium jilantaiense]SEW24433.1 trk system potassium uptake protein TrkH [Halobacterium jilantaiense]